MITSLCCLKIYVVIKSASIVRLRVQMKLGITSIQRNRGRYLNEWVSFHYLVGFRKFYIYLHKCTDNSLDVLDVLRRKYDISYCVVRDDLPLAQLSVYQVSYNEHNHEVDWMAFIDGDEFLFSPGILDIRNSLEPHFYKKTSALCPYWVCFGSSGHINEPDGLITENFRLRGALDQSVNFTVKSLIKGRQGSLINVSSNPHVFLTPLGSYDEKDRLITDLPTGWRPSHDTIRINHYVTQSRKFFEQNKRSAGTALDPLDKTLCRYEDWWNSHDTNEFYDDSMDFYLPELRKLMSNI